MDGCMIPDGKGRNATFLEGPFCRILHMYRVQIDSCWYKSDKENEMVVYASKIDARKST